MTTSRDCKEIKPVNPEGNEPWIFTGRTDAETETPALTTWCEELTPWKRPWCWERLKAGEAGLDRGWDGWMASLTQWTWVWVGSRSWWWTWKSGVLQSKGLQRVRHVWATELNLGNSGYKQVPEYGWGLFSALAGSSPEVLVPPSRQGVALAPPCRGFNLWMAP